MHIETDVLALPSYWACYLINADSSGISDEEQAEIDAYTEKLKPWHVSCPDGESYFGTFEGLGCDLLDYPIYREITALEKFNLTYEKHLRESILREPDLYAWPAGELPQVIERMRAAIERGSFNKNSVAFRRTCRELKIPYTYQAIAEFIKS